MAHTRFLRAPFAVAAFLGFLLLSTSSFADSYVRIVRLSDLSGKVEIDRNTGHGFEKAIMNMPITQGVRLRTGKSGHAEVEFENGTALRLTGNSTVGFTQLSLRGEGQRLSEIQIGGGTVYVDYRRKGNDDFRVMLGNKQLELNKDARFRVQLDNGEAQVAVLKGELQVQGLPESAKVKKNQTFTLDLNDASQYELAKGIRPLGSDEYNQQRTQYLEMASNRSYGSPYAYGYSDLNRWGSFFNLPGYGLVWQPIGMSMSWDPFSNGYWSFYPGYGYMFISSYPWGWMPYRYGNWAFAQGAGWVWVPGGWNRWNTGVTVYNPPTQWKPPSIPATGSGGTVVVGHPLPPVRTAQDDALRPPRRDRLDPMGRDGMVMTDRTRVTPAPPANSAVTAPATATPPATVPAATAPVRPARPSRVMDEPMQMNKATREYNTRMERMQRTQPMPRMTPGMATPSMPAPSATQAPASAPVHQAAPPPPPPAPAPRMSEPRMSEPRMAPHKVNPNPK